MNLLCIIAHPDLTKKSFTSQLMESFIAGAQSNKNINLQYYNVYDTSISHEEFKRSIIASDHICFAFPLWWEMPPAALVDFFQKIFINGFAFSYNTDGTRELLISKNITCLISMGQKKDYNVSNLQQAMEFCGLSAQFVVFQGVGPGMSTDMIDIYKDLARRQGFSILKD